MEDPGYVLDEPWLMQVRQGDFSTVPDPLDWDSSYPLVHQVDGWRLAKAAGVGNAIVRWTEERRKEAERTGSWPGTVVEQWLALWWLHRTAMFTWDNPGRDEPALVQRLCDLLRQGLREITPDEHARLVRLDFGHFRLGSMRAE